MTVKKILFPLYMKEDEQDFLFYRNVFVKEGFLFAESEEERLLLRADAVLMMANILMKDDEIRSSLLATALQRNIPVILIHAARMEELKENENVIDAKHISFAGLKELINTRQQDIYRKEEEEPRGSRWFIILCMILTALLAGILLWRAASFTMHNEETALTEVSPISEAAKQAVVRVYAIGSMNEEAWRGSGFVISDDGYIVTNAHVIDHASVSYYAIYRENRYEAEVIDISASEDIALIRIHTPTHYRLKVSEDVPLRDDPLYTLGYPGSQKLTVLEGSSYGRTIRFEEEGVTYMPIHMALKAGISGSPVLDQRGNVAGIASAVSLNDENLSYMVPCDIVLDFLKDHIFLAD